MEVTGEVGGEDTEGREDDDEKSEVGGAGAADEAAAVDEGDDEYAGTLPLLGRLALLLRMAEAEVLLLLTSSAPTDEEDVT